jgi:hypothetical protein
MGRLPVTNEHEEALQDLLFDKRGFYGALATQCGGLEHVTELHVENHGGDWLEFNQYIAEMLRDQERHLWIVEQECRTLGIDPATIYANWTKDPLGFWHSDPSATITTEETAGPAGVTTLGHRLLVEKPCVAAELALSAFGPEIRWVQGGFSDS